MIKIFQIPQTLFIIKLLSLSNINLKIFNFIMIYLFQLNILFYTMQNTLLKIHQPTFYIFHPYQ
jgi:hypothetical protein